MEGGTLEHVARVLGGQPLYVAPSLEFTPYIYAPLYYYVTAPFAYLFGLRLLPLRMVSFAASLGVFALIAALVHGRTRSRLGALVGAGLFAALFDRTGAFFDLARVDALALFFMFLGVWVMRASERHDVAAGLLLAAAVFTKQSMLLMAAPIVLARAWSLRGPRRLQCQAAFVVVAVAGGLLLHRQTHGWSTYYLFTLPASHPWVPGAWFRYWRDDLFGAVPVAVLALVLVIARARGARPARPVELAAVLGSLLEAWSSRVHAGAYSNVLMPVYACLAWQTGTVLGDLDQAVRAPASGAGAVRAKPGFVAAFAPWACLLQLALLWYRPWRLVPTAADRAAGAALVATIAAVPGPVLVPHHPHLARLAGKATSAQEMALSDVLRGRDRSIADALAADVNQRLRRREFAAVVVDDDWWPVELNASYRPSQTLFAGAPAVFWPRTGWPTRPQTIYDRRP
jgi:4-amino-4-deoxy-L-arabinose transferase-like glycosyltransferase